VGGNETVKVDVRVIAATNQPLEQAVSDRRFREDLFYRLNVVRLHLPPLRERGGDIPLLTNYFLGKVAQGAAPKSIAPDALEALCRYRWPGNVRELENVVHRATVMAKGQVVLLGDLPAEVAALALVVAPAATAAGADGQPGSPAAPGPPAPTTPQIGPLAQALFDWARQHPQLRVLPAVERELVLYALRETRGNQVQAARLLGITRATLRKRMQKFVVKSELNFS
jgi:two-component system nitrogen regulation response regulator GlnG